MRRIRILAAIVVVAGLILSCAGAPKTPEQPPPPEVKTVSGRPEAEAARQAADAAKVKADAERASIAAKDEYTAALEAYKKGDAELAAQRYAEAKAAYNLSENGYLRAAQVTVSRRAAAQAAMKSADASLQATDERLKVIETEIGGGTP